MKQSISPGVAAVIVVVVLILAVLLGYKYVLSGPSKGKSTEGYEAKMQEMNAQQAGGRNRQMQKGGAPTTGSPGAPPGG